MFSFLKKTQKQEPKKENNLLEIENSVFHTEAPASISPVGDNSIDDYQSFVYQPPVYDVAPYKVVRKERPPIVVDKEQLGYKANDYHENVSTVELIKEENPSETINLEELNTIEEETSSNLADLNPEPIEEVAQKKDEFIHIPSLSNINNSEGDNNDDSLQFNLFGSRDGVESIKEQQSFEEEPVKLIGEVKYTEDGHKICPNCGTILRPDAPICFMCSKSFVLKK